jgi:hypothetical protein
MNKWYSAVLIPLLLLTVAIPSARAQGQYPVMEKVAQKVIDHYRTSSCQELMAKKQQPPSAGKDKAIQLLHDDPQMRQQFLNKVAGPIANKLFECGMVP